MKSYLPDLLHPTHAVLSLKHPSELGTDPAAALEKKPAKTPPLGGLTAEQSKQVFFHCALW